MKKTNYYFFLAVITAVVFSVTLFLTACADDNQEDFTLDDLDEYLASQPYNTKETPYSIALIIGEDDFQRLAFTLNRNSGKYVYLDLSSSAITTIPDDAFHQIDPKYNSVNGTGCFTLAGITIPDSVISIGFGAFWWCNNLTSVTIGNNVTSIGGSAFSDCKSLTSVTIPNSVTSIGIYAFASCDNLTAINTAAYNAAYTAENGVLYNKDKTSLIQYPAGKTGGFTIPNGVINIERGAFYGCTSLTSVTIPNNVTSIGYVAFSGCKSLNSITIENGITTIGEYGFFDCSSLVSVTIPDSVTSIETRTFYKCSSLASVTIGNGVTSIGGGAFLECKGLTSVIIGSSVTSIEGEAFGGCSSITSVTFEGTILKKDISDYAAFPYGLLDKFYETDNTNGTPGTYTRPRTTNYVWTKQP
jgi:Flp pilus assembly protein protease CpaA